VVADGVVGTGAVDVDVDDAVVVDDFLPLLLEHMKMPESLEQKKEMEGDSLMKAEELVVSQEEQPHTMVGVVVAVAVVVAVVVAVSVAAVVVVVVLVVASAADQYYCTLVRLVRLSGGRHHNNTAGRQHDYMSDIHMLDTLDIV